jgi:hypothetical protein
MSSSSKSTSSNPLSDIKPTLSDSPTDFFINRTANNVGSNVSESLLGDSVTRGNLAKSTFGDSLTGSSQNITLGKGATITDGGATMAMFNLASKVVEQNNLSNLVQTMQGGGVNTATSAGATSAAGGDIVAKIKDFYSEHKGAVIAGGLLLGFLVYKGFAK